MLLGELATAAAGLFAGAAVYITLVEHPARLGCGVAVALTEFRPSYERATVMQVSLAIIGTAAALAQWATAGGLAWLAGALLLGGVVPFTLVAILPTNARLLDPALDGDAVEAAELLARWGRLHAVRSASSLCAFVIFARALAHG